MRPRTVDLRSPGRAPFAGLVLALACGSLLPRAVRAQEGLSADEPLLGLGVGYFDVSGPKPALHARVEYRSRPVIRPLRVWAQIEATGDSGVGAFAGLLLDVRVGGRVVVTPSTSVGLWRVGDGKDLGSAVVFRSTAEASYRLDSGWRVGVALGHISNAGIGARNPGVNIASLSYSMPLRAPGSHRAP